MKTLIICILLSASSVACAGLFDSVLSVAEDLTKSVATTNCKVCGKEINERNKVRGRKEDFCLEHQNYELCKGGCGKYLYTWTDRRYCPECKEKYIDAPRRAQEEAERIAENAQRDAERVAEQAREKEMFAMQLREVYKETIRDNTKQLNECNELLMSEPNFNTLMACEVPDVKICMEKVSRALNQLNKEFILVDTNNSDRKISFVPEDEFVASRIDGNSIPGGVICHNQLYTVIWSEINSAKKLYNLEKERLAAEQECRRIVEAGDSEKYSKSKYPYSKAIMYKDIPSGVSEKWLTSWFFVNNVKYEKFKYEIVAKIGDNKVEFRFIDDTLFCVRVKFVEYVTSSNPGIKVESIINKYKKQFGDKCKVEDREHELTKSVSEFLGTKVFTPEVHHTTITGEDLRVDITYFSDKIASDMHITDIKFEDAYEKLKKENARKEAEEAERQRKAKEAAQLDF